MNTLYANKTSDTAALFAHGASFRKVSKKTLSLRKKLPFPERIRAGQRKVTRRLYTKLARVYTTFPNNVAMP